MSEAPEDISLLSEGDCDSENKNDAAYMPPPEADTLEARLSMATITAAHRTANTIKSSQRHSEAPASNKAYICEPAGLQVSSPEKQVVTSEGKADIDTLQESRIQQIVQTTPDSRESDQQLINNLNGPQRFGNDTLIDVIEMGRSPGRGESVGDGLVQDRYGAKKTESIAVASSDICGSSSQPPTTNRGGASIKASGFGVDGAMLLSSPDIQKKVGLHKFVLSQIEREADVDQTKDQTVRAGNASLESQRDTLPKLVDGHRKSSKRKPRASFKGKNQQSLNKDMAYYGVADICNDQVTGKLPRQASKGSVESIDKVLGSDKRLKKLKRSIRKSKKASMKNSIESGIQVQEANGPGGDQPLVAEQQEGKLVRHVGHSCAQADIVSNYSQTSQANAALTESQKKLAKSSLLTGSAAKIKKMVSRQEGHLPQQSQNQGSTIKPQGHLDQHRKSTKSLWSPAKDSTSIDQTALPLIHKSVKTSMISRKSASQSTKDLNMNEEQLLESHKQALQKIEMLSNQSRLTSKNCNAYLLPSASQLTENCLYLPVDKEAVGLTGQNSVHSRESSASRESKNFSAGQQPASGKSELVRVEDGAALQPGQGKQSSQQIAESLQHLQQIQQRPGQTQQSQNQSSLRQQLSTKRQHHEKAPQMLKSPTLPKTSETNRVSAVKTLPKTTPKVPDGKRRSIVGTNKTSEGKLGKNQSQRLVLLSASSKKANTNKGKGKQVRKQSSQVASMEKDLVCEESQEKTSKRLIGNNFFTQSQDLEHGTLQHTMSSNEKPPQFVMNQNISALRSPTERPPAPQMSNPRKRISKIKIQSPTLRHDLKGNNVNPAQTKISDRQETQFASQANLPAIATDQSINGSSNKRRLMSPVSIHSQAAQVAARSGTPTSQDLAKTFSPMLQQLKSKQGQNQRVIASRNGNAVVKGKTQAGSQFVQKHSDVINAYNLGPQTICRTSLNLNAEKSGKAVVNSNEKTRQVTSQSKRKKSLLPLKTQSFKIQSIDVQRATEALRSDQVISPLSQKSNLSKKMKHKKSRLARHASQGQNVLESHHMKRSSDKRDVNANQSMPQLMPVDANCISSGLSDQKQMTVERSAQIKDQNKGSFQTQTDHSPHTYNEASNRTQSRQQSRNQIDMQKDELVKSTRDRLKTPKSPEMTDLIQIGSNERQSGHTTHRRQKSSIEWEGRKLSQGQSKFVRGTDSVTNTSCVRHDCSMRSAGPRPESSDRNKTAFFDTTLDNEKISKGNRRKLFQNALPKAPKYTHRLEQIKQVYASVNPTPIPANIPALKMAAAALSPIGQKSETNPAKIRQKTALKNLLYGNESTDQRASNDKGFYQNLIRLTRQATERNAEIFEQIQRSPVQKSQEEFLGAIPHDTRQTTNFATTNLNNSKSEMSLGRQISPKRNNLKELMATLQTEGPSIRDFNTTTAQELARTHTILNNQETKLDILSRIYDPMGGKGSPLRYGSPSKLSSAKRSQSPKKSQHRPKNSQGRMSSQKSEDQEFQEHERADVAEIDKVAKPQQVQSLTAKIMSLKQGKVLVKKAGSGRLTRQASTNKVIIRNQGPEKKVQRLLATHSRKNSQTATAAFPNENQLPNNQAQPVENSAFAGNRNFVTLPIGKHRLSSDAAIAQSQPQLTQTQSQGAHGAHMTFYNTNFFIQGPGGSNTTQQSATNAPAAGALSRKASAQIVVPQSLITKAAQDANMATKELQKVKEIQTVTGQNPEESSSFIEDDDGDESPRNYIKVFEVECCVNGEEEDETIASPTTGGRSHKRKRLGVSIKNTQKGLQRDSSGPLPKKGFRRRRTHKKSQSNALLLPPMMTSVLTGRANNLAAQSTALLQKAKI